MLFNKNALFYSEIVKKLQNSGRTEPWGEILLGGFEEDCFRSACHSRPFELSQGRLPQQPFDGL
jgi:hypothetical protein